MAAALTPHRHSSQKYQRTTCLQPAVLRPAASPIRQEAQVDSPWTPRVAQCSSAPATQRSQLLENTPFILLSSLAYLCSLAFLPNKPLALESLSQDLPLEKQTHTVLWVYGFYFLLIKDSPYKNIYLLHTGLLKEKVSDFTKL